MQIPSILPDMCTKVYLSSLYTPMWNQGQILLNIWQSHFRSNKTGLNILCHCYLMFKLNLKFDMVKQD
ncbi:hypothetical protein M0802_016926 [Mischocyttarus mexicanus]|nr:hypothetical protein M0802_016926 [Mischocyttarus mexicanus]